jgi:WD40 repeat protein
MRANLPLLLLLCCVAVAGPAQTVRQEKTVDLPAGASVLDATISRAGNLVAAMCSDRLVRVWSAHSGELLRTIDENGQLPSAVQFSTDDRLLAVAFEIVEYEKGEIKVFDVGSWKVQYDLATPFTMYTLVFSPDGHRLAFSDFHNDTEKIWDLESGKNLIDISAPFGGSVSLSFSPDGRWVASADGDAFVRVHDALNGSLRSATKGYTLEPTAVAFFPDGGKLLAGGVEKTISVIETASGNILRTLPKQPGVVWSVDVSPDGKQAAVVVYTSAERLVDINHLTLSNLDHGTILADFQKPGITIYAGTFVGDQYFFVAASTNQLSLWSLR